MKEFVSNALSKLHLLILLYGAWSFYSIYSEFQTQIDEIVAQKPAIEEEIKKAEKKLGQIDEFRKNVDQTKLRVNGVFSNIEKVQRQLPSEINDIEILEFLSREGRSLNVPELEPNPKDEQPMGFYISKQYNIKGRATFLQFVVFLERINGAERLFNVKNFRITAPVEAQKGRFQVVNFDATIDTFKFNSSYKESSGVEEIETEFGGKAPKEKGKNKAGAGGEE
jgi:Tfp pilus assembly protein PilO